MLVPHEIMEKEFLLAETEGIADIEELNKILERAVNLKNFLNDPPHLKKWHLLLTGFDAPILYAMYLDKPMRDHTLLQAIARVNRPYENEAAEMVKPHGFVLDFVGIFDKLSCSTAGNLNFNSELLALDRKVGDYVIVHELLHFSVPNHGKLWKSLMRAHLGDYEKLEEQLEKMVRSKR